MKFFKLLPVIICLLFPHPATAAEPVSGPEAADLFLEEMGRVLEIQRSGETASLAESTHFTDLEQDEERGVIAFTSRAFLEATGKELVCFIYGDTAEIHMEAPWDEAPQQIAGALERSGLIPYAYGDSDTIATLIFRNPESELAESYDVIVLAVSTEDGETPEIALGYQTQDRTHVVWQVYDPDAAWALASPPDGSAYWAGVTLSGLTAAAADSYGTPTLMLRAEGDDTVMVLAPGLYPKWPEIDPDEKAGGIIRKLLEVRIDDTVLPLTPQGAAPTREAGVDTLTFPVSEELVAQMAGGRYIQFDLLTLLEEHVQLVFPLADVLETAVSAERLNRFAAVSPFIARVVNRDYEGVRDDISNGADVNRALPDGRTALHIATALQDTEMIDLLGKSPDLDTGARDGEGATCLDMAMELEEETDILFALLDIGCDPDIRDPQGRTLLMRTSGNLHQMELLIYARADVNATDPEGNTPLHYMAGDCDASPEQIDLLIRSGADPDRQASDGTTPLMAAVLNLCQDQIDALLAAAVDLDIRNDEGLTALEIARSYVDADLYGDKTMEAFGRFYDRGDMVTPIEVPMRYEALAEKLENSSRYGYGVQNKSSETVYVALRILDETDTWVTKKWFRIEPGEEALLARSSNRIFYLYAESDSYTWEGTDNYVTIDGEAYGMMEVAVDREYRGKIRYFGLK